MRAAASVAVADVVTGAPREVQVLAAFPAAVYLAHADGIVAVVTADGVAHPNAVVLTASTAERPLVRLHRGQPGVIGDGTVRVGDLEVSIARWFDPVPRLAPVTREELATQVAAARTHLAVVAAAGAPPEDLVAALRVVGDALSAGDADAAVAAARGLIGAGSGLTPAGDDMLAGLLAAAITLPPALAGRHRSLVTASALLAGTVGAVAPHIVERARHATTAISAELLHHAARGEVATPAAAALHALTGRRSLPAALDALLAVGATSGRDLAEGVLAGADVVLAATSPATATSPAATRPPRAAATADASGVPSLVPSAGAHR